MDILSFINLGIGIGETVYSVVKNQNRENIGDAVSKLENSVLKRAPVGFEDRFERATLVVKAMWEIMKEKTGLRDEDLRKKIFELDMSDGKLDGKIRKKPVICRKCGSGVSYKHKKCMICGEEYPELGEIDTF